MVQRLKDNITSRYFEAANRLNSKKARRRIVAYVESYEDVFFWRTVLSSFENEQRYFEVMLPSKVNLTRGKKSVLMNFIGNHVGCDMIACVDADYDYLLQGATETSRKILNSPYVFHTYVYAIENFQCVASSLHNVCVMVTLNDHAIFDFNRYFSTFSEIIYPLFVWSILLYRNGHYPEFSLTDMNRILMVGQFRIDDPHLSLTILQRKVKRQLNVLSKRYPYMDKDYASLYKELPLLGVTPQTTYLYIQGHHLFDNIVAPIVGKVCDVLRIEREREIYNANAHTVQKRNEIACYENATQESVKTIMRKNTGYLLSEPLKRLQDDLKAYLESETMTVNCDTEKLDTNSLSSTKG